MHRIQHGTADKLIAEMFQKQNQEMEGTRNEMHFEMKSDNAETGRNSFKHKATIHERVPSTEH